MDVHSPIPREVLVDQFWSLRAQEQRAGSGWGLGSMGDVGTHLGEVVMWKKWNFSHKAQITKKINSVSVKWLLQINQSKHSVILFLVAVLLNVVSLPLNCLQQPGSKVLALGLWPNCPGSMAFRPHTADWASRVATTDSCRVSCAPRVSCAMQECT